MWLCEKKIAKLAGEMNLSHVSMWKKNPRVWKGEAYSKIGKTCDEGHWTSLLSITFEADDSDFSLSATRQISLCQYKQGLFALFSLQPLSFIHSFIHS